MEWAAAVEPTLAPLMTKEIMNETNEINYARLIIVHYDAMRNKR